MRPTYAEIDLAAIRQNTAGLIDAIRPSELCAVVKADAYGHGDVPVAVAAIDAGASRLAVALVEEGERLREAGIEVPILILSEPDPDSIPALEAYDLATAAYSPDFVTQLIDSGVRVAVHVKVDTGMHRVGAPREQLTSLVTQISAAPRLDLEGLFTHFPVADEDRDFTHRQIERFDDATNGLEVPYLHLANSAGAILYPEARRDFCRIGLSLYGLHPSDWTRDLIDLRPAMRVVSHVSLVKELGKGARPSYGRVRPLPEKGPVATVPIGYADGYARRLTTHGSVLIRGRRRPFAGMITMDQIVLQVGDDVDVGDEVVLMGRQGSESITADELAEELGTITHEIVCRIGPRVPRRYVG